jgi:hypothetical protein
MLKSSDDGVLHLEDSCFGLCQSSNVSKEHVSKPGSVSVLSFGPKLSTAEQFKSQVIHNGDTYTSKLASLYQRVS